MNNYLQLMRRSFPIVSIQAVCWASCFVAILLVAPTMAVQESGAPPVATEPAPSVQSDDESTAENPVAYFRKIMAQIETNETEINRLYSTMPIGFPKLQQKYVEDIDDLKKSNAELGLKIDAAAMESFRFAPNSDPKATQIVLEIVSHKLDGQGTQEYFDPAGAAEIIGEVLRAGVDPKSGKSPAEAAYLAFRANYAIHDFALAGKTLDFIEKSGVKLQAAIREQLERTKLKWQRELEIRSQEATSDDLPRVKFETTEGDFVIELFENEAPKTVGNFISLVEKKFYNDLIFHLVKPGQISQTGCPLGDGSGDAGYKIPDENGSSNIRHHFAGTVSMSNKGEDTGGSQFFIAHQPNPNYDGNFTAFGRVIEGLDVVYKLRTADPAFAGLDSDQPSKVIRATVVRKRDHPYEPTRLANRSNTVQGSGAEIFQTEPDKDNDIRDVSPGGGRDPSLNSPR